MHKDTNMKRFFLIIFIIFVLVNVLKSQEIKFNFIELDDVRNDKTYSGFIDKYPITMTLFNHGNEIYGSYFYEKVKIPIKISGNITKYKGSSILVVKDGLTLKEFENNNPRAIINAGITEDGITGYWEDIKTKKKLSIRLTRINHEVTDIWTRYLFEARLKNQSIGFDYSENFRYKPTIDEVYKFKKENVDYFLLLASYPSRGEFNDRTYCGAGIEEFLIFLGINDKFEPTFNQVIQIFSCIKNIGTEYNGNSDGFSLSLKDSNIKNFDKLKLVISDNETTSTYELDSKNLELGFVKINGTKK